MRRLKREMKNFTNSERRSQILLLFSHILEKSFNMSLYDECLIYKEQNRIQELERDKIEQDLKKEKNDLSSLKEKREDWRKKNQRLKQETGIVNDKFLKEDFDMRKDEISLLTKDIEQLKKHHEQLTQIIEKANMIELSKEMGN
jgi:hypothetical protein